MSFRETLDDILKLPDGEVFEVGSGLWQSPDVHLFSTTSMLGSRDEIEAKKKRIITSCNFIKRLAEELKHVYELANNMDEMVTNEMVEKALDNWRIEVDKKFS